MAKGLRASSKKANRTALRRDVFGPVEDARTERLSQKLLELAQQPRERTDMEVDSEASKASGIDDKSASTQQQQGDKAVEGRVHLPQPEVNHRDSAALAGTKRRREPLDEDISPPPKRVELDSENEIHPSSPPTSDSGYGTDSDPEDGNDPTFFANIYAQLEGIEDEDDLYDLLGFVGSPGLYEDEGFVLQHMDRLIEGLAA